MDDSDEIAFRSFVEAKGATLMRAAFVLTGNRADAEDLLQDVLVEVARRWRTISTPDAYARRALYRRQVSRWRRGARGFVRTRVDSHPDPALEVSERVTLGQALLKLTQKQRAVLALRYLEDLPEGVVAEILNCSVGTVRSQTHRALARLRRLSPELIPPGGDVEVRK